VTFIITAVVIPIFLGVQSLITIGAVAMVIVFAKYMATVSYIAHFTGLWQTVLVTILFMAWLTLIISTVIVAIIIFACGTAS
jgi:hypothetical protein